VRGPDNNEGRSKIADRKQGGIPDFMIREERILSAILGPMGPHAEFKDNKAEAGSGLAVN
jgi:hypothetical protein